MSVVMYVNDARFEQSKYDDESIFKYSKVIHAQVDQHTP